MGVHSACGCALVLVFWVFLNSAILWVVQGILVCRRIIQWFSVCFKGCAKVILTSEGWNWHTVIPVIPRKGSALKFQMFVFLACSLIFFFFVGFFIGLYSIICSSTSVLLYLPPVLSLWIYFKQLNLTCLWWVIRFLSDVDRTRRKCKCTALPARVLSPAESAFECCVCVSGHVKGQLLRAGRCWPEGVGH